MSNLGLFESHLTVRNLDASIAFYRDVVGLELAYRIPERRAAFLWIGGRGKAMLGLWESPDAPIALKLHIAFSRTVEEVVSSPGELRERNVEPRGFQGQSAVEPDVIGWMPAATVYFNDPDGHLLEYIAMLPDSPRPEIGVVSLGEWRSLCSGN